MSIDIIGMNGNLIEERLQVMTMKMLMVVVVTVMMIMMVLVTVTMLMMMLIVDIILLYCMVYVQCKQADTLCKL